MCRCPQEKKQQMHFVMQLSIATVFELWKFLKLNAAIIYTVLPSSNQRRGAYKILLSNCVKYPRIWDFSDPHFPVHGPNHIRIFPYMDRIVESTIKYGSEKACILGYFTQCQIGYFTQCQTFFSILLHPLTFSLFDMKERRAKQ